MSRFVQLHILTVYPPSNPNRDDLGRPKTAEFGGATRLRISSQAIKRAIRTASVFIDSLGGAMGARTQRLGDLVKAHLTERGADEEKALTIARQVAEVFGKLKPEKDKNPTHIEQLAFISPQEQAFALKLADDLAEGKDVPKDKDLAKTVLQRADGAADIAMFGRMLADNPDFNRDAAVQVAHAITTNRVEVENDYYTAVDDLKLSSEDAGAGFIGETGFGAGVFYLYICIDRALLLKNLNDDRALSARAIEALVKATAVASPSGKRNSYANHVQASYMLAERGDAQPRSLASAFMTPVSERGGDQMIASIKKLHDQREAFKRVYGPAWDKDLIMNIHDPDTTVTLDALAAFAADALPEATP